MNTKKLRTTLLIILAVAAVCISSVLGTLAYLKSQDSVHNTFTVGNVDMDLDETDIKDGGRTDEGNEYKLFPGETYVKDPTVTIKANSEECYVRVLVTVKNADKLAAAAGKTLATVELTDIVTAIGSDWTFAGKTTSGNDVTYEYRYNGTVSAGASDVVLQPVFEEIFVPEAIDGDVLANYADVEIIVVGNAIQAEGFADANAAWAAF